MNLRRAKDTRHMQRTPGASNSLYVRAKTQQISVHSEWYAHRLQTPQHRFTVPSTHTRIWFANHSQAVHKPFAVLVYMKLNILKWCLSLTKSTLYLSDGEFYCFSLGLPLHNVHNSKGPMEGLYGNRIEIKSGGRFLGLFVGTMINFNFFQLLQAECFQNLVEMGQNLFLCSPYGFLLRGY